MLWAGPSFTVQAKSDTKPLVFRKEHELAWIRSQENPLFVAVGRKQELSVDFYSTWQRVSAMLQRAASTITLEFKRPPSGMPELVLSEDQGSQTIYLGEPVATITVPDLLEPTRAETLRAVLRRWIEVDRENIASAHGGVHWAIGPANYETDVVPPADRIQLALFWNPKNLNTCIRNFARSAAALRLTLNVSGQLSDFTAAQLSSLETALLAWRDALDPAAREALQKNGMPHVG
jgi:hypothetical protein